MDDEEEMTVKLQKNTMKRFRYIISVLVKHGFLDLVEKLRLRRYLPLSARIYGEGLEEGRKIPEGVRLRILLTELGPSFIKLGQFLSGRADIFPPNILQELEKLQDRVPPVPFSEAKKEIRKGLGRPLGQVFSSIEPTPLGNASIGQVHRATLLSGRKVVIKVQRPGVEKIIQEDIKLMKLLARLVERYLPGSAGVYKPTDIVKQFSRMITKELDYRREAWNLEKTRNCFEGDPNIYIPKTHLEYTTKTVLVQDFVVGKKMNTISKKAVKPEIVEKIVGAYLKQVLVFGIYQADPHLGNIFLRKDGTIGIIDFGAVGSIDKQMKERMGEWFSTVIHKDIEGMVNVVSDIGVLTAETNRRELREDVSEFVHEYIDIPIEELTFKKVYGDMTEIIRRNKLKFPPRFLLLIRAFATAEGMVKKFHPTFNLVSFSAPFIAKLDAERNRPKRKLVKTTDKLGELSRFLTLLSPSVTDIVEKTSEGKMKFELGHSNLESEVSKLDSAVNKVALSAIVSALIIGSSLVLVSDTGPMFYGFPAVGVAGMIIAAFLGFIAIIRIFGSE